MQKRIPTDIPRIHQDLHDLHKQALQQTPARNKPENRRKNNKQQQQQTRRKDVVQNHRHNPKSNIRQIPSLHSKTVIQHFCRRKKRKTKNENKEMKPWKKKKSASEQKKKV